jgi:hypothetical protein
LDSEELTLASRRAASANTIARDQLIIHADRGPSMTRKTRGLENHG